MNNRKLLVSGAIFSLSLITLTAHAAQQAAPQSSAESFKDPVYRQRIRTLYQQDQKALNAKYQSKEQQFLTVERQQRREGRILKELIAKYGWPTYSRVGKAGSGAAMVLILHQDADPKFQKRALSALKPLVQSNAIPKPWYGYLYDRVMHHEGKKQEYGTQGHCIKTGKNAQWEPFPIKNRKDLNIRRKDLGLTKESAYIRVNTRLLCKHPLHLMH